MLTTTVELARFLEKAATNKKYNDTEEINDHCDDLGGRDHCDDVAFRS